ncbi:secretogranin-1 [Ctenodactylus gundi]
MQPAALLSLLGAAALAAVSSVPVENRSHNEEMVTRCIIEVLSNALSKANVPPVTPECRQVLKKSEKEIKNEEKSDNENKKFEVRLLRDPGDTSEAHRPLSREDPGASEEEDSEGQTKAHTEAWKDGGEHSQEGAEPQQSLYPSNSQDSKEAKIHPSGKIKEENGAEVEGGSPQKKETKEDARRGKYPKTRTPLDSFLNKRNQVSTEKEALLATSGTHSAGLSEKTHSRENTSQESREEMSQEKRPEESHSLPQGQEESEESEEDDASEAAKRGVRPRHHHGRSRPDRAFQEGTLPSEERGHALEGSQEANVGLASVEEKRDHHATHFRASEEEPEYGEVRSYPGVQAPEDLEGGQHGGRGNEEYRAPRPHSDGSWEEEDKRTQPSLELGKIAHRHSKESGEERSYEGGKGSHHRSRGGVPRAYSSPDTREEKRFLGEGYYHIQESQMDKAKRHPQDEWQEQDKNYLNYGEEGAQEKWRQQENLRDPLENGEESRLQDEQYALYHTNERRKRLGVLFNPYFDPLQWKSSHFERKDNMADSFLEDEDENGLTVSEKNFFPEYTYDWWEKKPFPEDVNWGYEKRSFPRAPTSDLKRQYDQVAELDQLLHYRKKSAEFPDFYDSEEPMDTRREAENEQEGDDQRVLTEEEERELENLAAMDLELQKIAERFSQTG